jgi:hypothetical protein
VSTFEQLFRGYESGHLSIIVSSVGVCTRALKGGAWKSRLA